MLEDKIPWNFEEENNKEAWIGSVEKEKGEKDRKVFEKV